MPGKYFNTNVDNRLMYLGCVLLLLLICIVPALMKRYDEKSENSAKGYLVQTLFLAIVIGMEMGLFNVYNLIEIIKQTYKTNDFFRLINGWLDKNDYFTIIVVVVLGLISVLGITLIDKLRKIKWYWIKAILGGIWCIALLISLLVTLYGTIFELSISIEDKTKYEFVTIDSD